jgi:hypothetical protein
MPFAPRILITAAVVWASSVQSGIAEDHSHPVPKSPQWLTFPGSSGPGRGKHIVLVAADQEYRSEQVMPMLAKILSKRHGFDCTVLFSLNARNEVDPTQKIRWQDKRCRAAR